MLRRIALTLVPSVALFTVAALVMSALTPRATPKAARTLAPSAPVVQVAARSGYIVASS